MSNNYFIKHSDNFLNTIYGNLKGEIRLAVLQRDLLHLIVNKKLRILDLGAGAGQIAIWLASFGHHIDLVDISKPLLDKAQNEADKLKLNLNIIQADFFNLPNFIKKNQYDLIINHAVVEWLENAEELFPIFNNLLRKNAYLSIMYFNKSSLKFIHNVFGNFDYIDNNFHSKNSAKMTPKFPKDLFWTKKYLQNQNVNLISSSAIRCFYDYMKEKDRIRHSKEQIITRELIVSKNMEYASVARYIHEIWQKNS